MTSSSRQKEILLTLLQGELGDTWADGRLGWDANSELEVCEWDGIICNPDDPDAVQGIELDSSGFIGTLPSEIGLLNTLLTISMSQNSIKGTVPQLIANLPHLENLNLAENELTGHIPTFASPGLISFQIQHNLFTGSLPRDIGNRHSRLNYFDVSNNKLTGTIPLSLDEMKQLQTLALAENRLSGTIPTILGDLKQMIFLFLNKNELMGTIPPELANFESPLAEIWIQENLLSGTIPAAIADLPDLQAFYIDGNKFTGTIPSAICELDLNEEFFDGVNMAVERNYCDSVACPVGFFSLEGVFPCKKCPTKYSNPYLGRMGQCVDLNQDDILKIVSSEWKVEAWQDVLLDKENSNQLMTPDDWCSLDGVTCDGNQNIIALKLAGMGLSGKIPEEIGFLEFLQVLDISDNKLTGYIPSDLRWAPLLKLDVSGNELIGIVPSMLCLKSGVNGNGKNGEYDCSHIACKVGTYHHSGIGGAVNDNCIPCSTASFLGSKICPKGGTGTRTQQRPSHITAQDYSGGALFGIFLSLMFGIVFVALVLLRYFGSKNLMLHEDQEMYATEIEVNDDMGFSFGESIKPYGDFTDIRLHHDDNSTGSDRAVT